MSLTAFINSLVSSVSISMSIASTSANLLKRAAFPSITGLDANAPRFPSPSTAVPLDTIATKLPLAVYLNESALFL